VLIRTKNTIITPRSDADLRLALRGLCNGSGKPKEDVALFVPIRLALPSAALKTDGATGGGAKTIDRFPWVFSTFDVDRFNERVDPAGWELDGYNANPVVLWAHNSDIPAIGKAENVKADEGGLRGEVVFCEKDYDEFGWAIGQRVKAGIIRAGSVGFQVLEVEIPDKAEQEKGVFVLPRKFQPKHAPAYLVQTRKIDVEIVNKMIKQHKISEDERRNCMFSSP
jgi:phage head maturation protease